MKILQQQQNPFIVLKKEVRLQFFYWNSHPKWCRIFYCFTHVAADVEYMHVKWFYVTHVQLLAVDIRNKNNFELTFILILMFLSNYPLNSLQTLRRQILINGSFSFHKLFPSTTLLIGIVHRNDIRVMNETINKVLYIF